MLFASLYFVYTNLLQLFLLLAIIFQDVKSAHYCFRFFFSVRVFLIVFCFLKLPHPAPCVFTTDFVYQ